MRSVLSWVLLCSAFACLEARADPSDEVVAHGKALVEAADCASCHTADAQKPFAGGKRIDTPFGAIYAPNLTPDRVTGIGAWSDANFVRALRLGAGELGLFGQRGSFGFRDLQDAQIAARDLEEIRALVDAEVGGHVGG